MRVLRVVVFFGCLFCQQIFSQDIYSSFSIPGSLAENANAILRLEESHIEIKAFDNLHIKRKAVVTVLNKKGNPYTELKSFYDDTDKIKKMEAVVYNASGKKIEKIKKKDFNDVSASSSMNLYSDNRVKYFNYTPTTYPYTVEFYIEYTTTSTAFMPRWHPLKGYNISVETSRYTIENPKGLKLHSKKKNFENYTITSSITDNKVVLEASEIKAISHEVYSPPFQEIRPFYVPSLETFQLVDVPATVNSWGDFGKWQNEKLLAGRGILPKATILEVENLVANVEDTVEKARLIYEYMQQKTRYISVQIGIGGWQPSPATEVDQMGYGDCKGLSNYTKALLESQGIEAYYTILYSDHEKTDIDDEIVTLQGNHAILTVPIDGENYFLECTNQKVPFNFIGSNNDDRKVIVVTPEGGEIVKTKKYTNKENFQKSSGSYTLYGDGSASASVILKTGGIQYQYRYRLDYEDEKEILLYYKNYWDYLHIPDFEEIEHENNKRAIAFKQQVAFAVDNYMDSAGNDMFFTLNMFNREQSIPPRYSNRNFPLYISRGFTDHDEVEITLPEGYSLTALPEPVSIENQFGSYEISAEQTAENTILYKRKLQTHEGTFPKEAYEKYRTFWRQIIKHDKEKALITKVE